MTPRYPVHFAAARAAQWHARQAVERAEHSRELLTRLHMHVPRVMPVDGPIAALFYKMADHVVQQMTVAK